MNYLKLAVMTVLLTTSLVALGSGKQISTWLGENQPVSQTSTDLTHVEALFGQLEFDPQNRTHQIRKSRIEHYLHQARTYEESDWDYNRDEALERAQNIMMHHERMESGIYASI